MTIVRNELPPVWDAAVSKFKLNKIDDAKPLFAYAPYIYDPFCAGVPPCIMAHEEVHIRRQGNNPAAWWRAYIANEDFRIAEEILSHLAEYHVLADDKSWKIRQEILNNTAKRLNHLMYGYDPPLSLQKAKALL